MCGFIAARDVDNDLNGMIIAYPTADMVLSIKDMRIHVMGYN